MNPQIQTDCGAEALFGVQLSQRASTHALQAWLDTART